MVNQPLSAVKLKQDVNYIFFFDSLKFMRKEPVHKELKMLKSHAVDPRQVGIISYI
jgi:hypothetical protein